MATTITPSGNISCGDLLATVALADNVWSENQSKKQYIAQTGALDAILENQTVTLSELQDPMKDNELKVIWTEMCGMTTTACTDLCSPGATTEINSGCTSYQLACLQETGFSVKLTGFYGSYFDMEMAIAKGLLKASKELDEYLAKQAVVALNSYAGVNKYETGLAQGVAFDSIPAAYWGADLMAEFAQIGIMNKFVNPYILSGSNLYKSSWLAMMNQGNAEGAGNARKFDYFNSYFDLFNVDTINNPDKVSYLIDPNAIGFINKARYSSTPVEYGNGADVTLFSIPSKNIPSITYDVIYKTRCVGNDIFGDWKIKVTGSFVQNPLGCDSDITGVLKFKCA